MKDPKPSFTTARTLVRVLDTTLRLLHPYVPFVTEEIWQHLKAAAGDRFAPPDGWPQALIIAPWPMGANIKQSRDIADFTHIMDLVRAIRNARSENRIDAKLRIAATIIAEDSATMLSEQRDVIAALAQLANDKLEISDTSTVKPSAAITLVVGSSEIYLPVAGMVDPTSETLRLQKEIAAMDTQIKRLQDLLNGPFIEKAPPPVVQKERDKLAEYQTSQAKLKLRLERLEDSL